MLAVHGFHDVLYRAGLQRQPGQDASVNTLYVPGSAACILAMGNLASIAIFNKPLPVNMAAMPHDPV